MASINIPRFREKLDALRASGKSRPQHKDVAARLGVKKQTLAGWLRDGGKVPSDRQKKLITFLIEEASVELSEDQAHALWLGDIEDFKAALIFVAPTELDDVLRSNSDRLAVLYVDLPAGFGLDEEALEHSDEPIYVHDGTRFRLKAECDPTQRLLVLSWFSSGWRRLAPGKLHSGSIDGSGLIVFPEQQNLTFRKSYGIRRYVFIEHDMAFLANLPSCESGDPLRPDVVSQFARRLQRAQSAGRWRWGQVELRAQEDPQVKGEQVKTELAGMKPAKKSPARAKPKKRMPAKPKSAKAKPSEAKSAKKNLRRRSLQRQGLLRQSPRKRNP